MRVTIFLSLLLLVSACKEPANKSTSEIKSSEIDTLESELKSLKREKDSLQVLLDDYISANVYSWFGDKESKPFKEIGIEEPKNYIITALRNNSSVIPLEGVLGGTMFFTDIEILGTKWIVASYEDGHIMGRSIFTYRVNPTTMEVRFKVLDQVTDY